MLDMQMAKKSSEHFQFFKAFMCTVIYTIRGAKLFKVSFRIGPNCLKQFLDDLIVVNFSTIYLP